MERSDEPDADVLTRGLGLLRAGQFFAAHECFEDAWRSSPDTDGARMQALAQLSASYHQLSLGRARAAVRTWQKACNRLAAIGALSSDYQRSVEDFWTCIGVSAEAPRFIRVEDLPPRERWPYPHYMLRWTC